MHTQAAATLMTAITEMAPMILAHTIEMEAEHRLPASIVAAMKSAGIFRMFVPSEYDGLELELPAITNVIRSLSRIDASVGWTAMIGAGSALFATTLPRRAFERIYRDNRDVIIAGSTQPRGSIEQQGHAWHASGVWPFASDCQNADWMLGFCQLAADENCGSPQPKVVVAILPAAHWTIQQTWRAQGLKGTGSHHIALNSPVSPDTDFFDLTSPERWASGPLYGGVPQIIALLHGAVSLGIAEGALDDLLTIAASGRRQERAEAPMSETEAFQTDLGHVHADIRAAGALLSEQVQSHWQHALSGSLATSALLVEGSQAAIWTVGTCVRAVDKCFALGGSAALYDDSPLQRRMRDIHVAAQHNLMQPRHYIKAGKLLVAG